MSDERERVERADAALLEQVGATPGERKPLSVWAVQIVFAVQGVAGLLFAVREPPDYLMIALFGGIAAAHLGLVVAIQKRSSWARAAATALLVLSIIGSSRALLGDLWGEERAAAPGAPAIHPEERSGALFGRGAYIVLLVVLTARFGFGAPARKFLSGTADGPRSLRENGPLSVSK